MTREEDQKNLARIQMKLNIRHAYEHIRLAIQAFHNNPENTYEGLFLSYGELSEYLKETAELASELRDLLDKKTLPRRV